MGYLKVNTLPLRCLDIVYGGVMTTDRNPAVQAILAHLRKQLASGACDQVTFNHLPVTDRFTTALLASRGFRARIVTGPWEPHWHLTLTPGSYEETIAHFTRKHRYNMRRADRLLVEHFDGNVALKRIERPEEIDGFADAAAGIASHSYQAAIGAAFESNNLHRSLLHMEAECGRLRAYLLDCSGEPIAFQIGVAYGATYHLLATAFLPQHRRLSPGQVLLVRVIRDLSEGGFDRIDYGFGDSRYKQIYGTRNWKETTISLYGPSLRASAALLIHRITGAVARGGSLLAGRVGIQNRVKNWWRTRLTPEHDLLSTGSQRR